MTAEKEGTQANGASVAASTGNDRERPSSAEPATVGTAVTSSNSEALSPQDILNLVGHQAETPAQKAHPFWSTQPVPQSSAPDSACGPIETKSVADVRSTPLSLIPTFEWSDVDITNDTQLEEAYQLLNLHYVEDGEQMFRFDYSRDFLRWALLPPGWLSRWHVGVRVKASKKLVAFITAVPATVAVHGAPQKMVEINFLCVHKKLRAKRLAPVLIQEITRRVNLENVWQAVYTAGAVLPSPVSTSRYYHRSLNSKKLVEVGFSRIAPRMTMARTIKLNALKSTPSILGIRAMKETDVPAACRLTSSFNERFDLRVNYSEPEFAHWFLPRKGVVYTYVVEGKDGEITDMCSFYSLPSSIIRHPKHKTLEAAYSFCNISNTVTPAQLMQDALIYANQEKFDVYNALDLARNDEFLSACKFHVGDGDLNFYIYNWMCPPIDRRKNALVLL
jgi:glycylpeptide N-tetradecanoyltransferase